MSRFFRPLGPWVALATAVCLSAGTGCQPDASSPADPAGEEATNADQDDAWSTPRTRMGNVANKTRPAPAVSWPGPWRQTDAGAFGPQEDPVRWYRVEAPDLRLNEAVRLAMDAMLPAIGTAVSRHVSVNAETARAVGQLEGTTGNVAIDAQVRGRITLMRVTWTKANG